MTWKPTREMYDRLPGSHLAAFRLRDRLPIIFDTTGEENPE